MWRHGGAIGDSGGENNGNVAMAASVQLAGGWRSWRKYLAMKA